MNRKPTKGKKRDPAHPPILPTGEIPKKLASRDQKIYDLIVRRFLAIFGNPAVHQTTHIDFEVEKEPFVLTGTITVKPGWQSLYGPYAEREEVELPAVKKGESFDQDSKHPLYCGWSSGKSNLFLLQSCKLHEWAPKCI